jgi:GNAT superfamily N-acetyltransferase
VRVRPAVADDVAEIVRFNAALAAETEDLVLDPAILTRGVTAVFDDPDRGLYLLAEADGAVVGQLMLTWEWSDWRNGLFWWIQSVFVTGSHRGRGVFKALYREAERLARNSGDACGVRLYVEQDNAVARATYERLGMRETAYRLMEVEFERS